MGSDKGLTRPRGKASVARQVSRDSRTVAQCTTGSPYFVTAFPTSKISNLHLNLSNIK